MGIGSSKQSAGGTLKGAYAPPLPGMAIPKIPSEDTKYAITCPHDKKGGDTMTVMLKGNKKTLTIPKLHVINNVSHVTRPGDKFFWTDYAWKKVIASTLPALPGGTFVRYTIGNGVLITFLYLHLVQISYEYLVKWFVVACLLTY